MASDLKRKPGPIGSIWEKYEHTAEPDIRPQLVSFFINPPSKLIDIAIMISM